MICSRNAATGKDLNQKVPITSIGEITSMKNGKTIFTWLERSKVVIKGPQKNFLEAALKLINADLKTIKPQELVDLSRAVKRTFGGVGQIVDPDADIGGIDTLRVLRELHATLTEYQTIIGNFFKTMMATINEQQINTELHRQIKEELFHAPPIARHSVKLDLHINLYYVPKLGDLRKDPDWSRYMKTKPAYLDFVVGKHQLMNDWPFGPKDRYSINVEITSADQNNGAKLLYDFIMALKHVPLAAFCKCKECGKWFLHTSERKRVYCSSQCRARRASRESYGKIKASNPTKYEETKSRGSERAKRSYREKKKAELGDQVRVGKKTDGTTKKED
jgi:hypothetical protein